MRSIEARFEDTFMQYAHPVPEPSAHALLRIQLFVAMASFRRRPESR